MKPTRLLAVAALVAFAAAVVLVEVLAGPDGGSGPPAKVGGNPRATPRQIPVPQGREVRNANPQPDWQPHPGFVPIFRYREVGDTEPGEEEPELVVSAADFRAQMDWLAAHGFEAVTLDAVQQAWFGGGTLPAKPFVVSFGGVRGDLDDVVVPDLRRRGWPADLVVDTDLPLHGANIAELLSLGWGLEVEGADPAAGRRRLERAFGLPVRNFAFPVEGFDPRKIAALKAAGFRGATEVGYGFAERSHPFELPAITIFAPSGVSGFVEAVHSRGGGVGA